MRDHVFVLCKQVPSVPVVHQGRQSRVLFFLMGRHMDPSKPEYKESCRKKIFATVHNMTEKEEIC